jgi:hypothetical protein
VPVACDDEKYFAAAVSSLSPIPMVGCGENGAPQATSTGRFPPWAQTTAAAGGNLPAFFETRGCTAHNNITTKSNFSSQPFARGESLSFFYSLSIHIYRLQHFFVRQTQNHDTIDIIKVGCETTSAADCEFCRR